MSDDKQTHQSDVAWTKQSELVLKNYNQEEFDMTVYSHYGNLTWPAVVTRSKLVEVSEGSGSARFSGHATLENWWMAVGHSLLTHWLQNLFHLIGPPSCRRCVEFVIHHKMCFYWPPLDVSNCMRSPRNCSLSKWRRKREKEISCKL